jgi:hypothetical protein
MPIASRFTFNRNDKRILILKHFIYIIFELIFIQLTKGGFSSNRRQLFSSVGEFPSSELVVDDDFT